MDYTKLIADLHQADNLTADHRILALTDRAARALEELTKPKQTDYTELVKALRSASAVSTAWEKLMFDAAAAIEALLKENKELIEDHPEMVEADGHWEWRKPNGEVLMPKRGEWVVREVDIPGEMHPVAFRCMCSMCKNEYVFPRIPQYCPDCGSMNTAKMEVQDGDT